MKRSATTPANLSYFASSRFDSEENNSECSTDERSSKQIKEECTSFEVYAIYHVAFTNQKIILEISSLLSILKMHFCPCMEAPWDCKFFFLSKKVHDICPTPKIVQSTFKLWLQNICIYEERKRTFLIRVMQSIGFYSTVLWWEIHVTWHTYDQFST